jgi:hypothetical protein
MSGTATSSQAITPLPPEADPVALAPVPEEGAAEDASGLLSDTKFSEFLNRIADYATACSNSDQMWRRRRLSVQLRKYVLGEYYGVFDKTRGWYSEKEEGDGIYYDPQTPTFIANLLKDLVKTKPRKTCTSRDPERVDKREAARVAERLLQLDDEQDFTPKLQQREWKWNLLTAGETYRITYFNPQKVGKGITVEKYEPLEIPGGDSSTLCPLCGSTEATEDGKCASCGNPQMDTFEALGTKIQVKKGNEYKQIGDTDYDVPDALEMTVIGDTDTIGEALIVLRDRMIPRCVLEDALGGALPSTGTPDHLSYKQLFDGTTNQSSKEFELLHYQELWVAPAVYSGQTIAVSEKTQGGAVLPKGKKAKELFPKGLYFSRVQKVIKTLYPQCAAECLSHAVNDIGEGFHGQGEWDLNELQDQLTEAKSMKMNSMLLDSTQPLLTRKGWFDEDQVENKFGLVLPVDVPNDRSLGEAMMRVPAGKMPADAYQLGEELKGQMQQRVGAFSTTSDAPDIKAQGTATGIGILTDQSISRRGPALQLYAQMEVDQAYQKLEMRQKYWPKKMYDRIASDLGSDAVKWFMECDIRRDISIGVVPDSWLPRTETQKQAGFQAFLSIAGQIVAAKGDPKLLDEILRKANDVFGGGINFADFETEAVEAQLRLDKLREVAEYTEQQFGPMLYDPATGAINETALILAYAQTGELLRLSFQKADPNDIFAQLPIDVMFDNHDEFIEAYTDWLKTAQGRQASQFQRTLVHTLSVYHEQAKAYRDMKMKQYAGVAQLPDLEAGLIANEATHGQSMEHSAEQKEQDLAYSAVEAAGAAQMEQAGLVPGGRTAQ